MIRVLGNSSERILLKDLNDVIYYKQIKEYTDQEYETSKDLKRAINKHKLTILAQEESFHGSTVTDGSQLHESAPYLKVSDLKSVLKEFLPQQTQSNVASEESLKGAVREIAPLIVDMVRQEISKLSISGTVQTKRKAQSSKYMSPEYVPDVNIDGMVSNIRAKKRISTSEDIGSSLAALRKLKKK